MRNPECTGQLSPDSLKKEGVLIYAIMKDIVKKVEKRKGEK